ncbi:MAG: TonB-dependent receptor [Bacteroidota bacterium]
MYRWLFSVCVGIGMSGSALGQTLQVQVVDEDNVPLTQVLVSSVPPAWAEYTDAEGQVRVARTDSVRLQYVGKQTRVIAWSDLPLAKGTVQLRSASSLPTVTVSEQQLFRDRTQQTVRIDARAIQALQAPTTVDALAQSGGIFVQKSQLGGGSPVLRGFEANRVLLVVDNVRMNNAIYRSGHLQNALTVDESALRTIDVKYGSGALAHGSDALGGVIHFKTKNPLPLAHLAKDEVRWSGSGGVRYASAAQERSAQVSFSRQSQRWSSFTALSATQFGDLRAGSRRPSAFPDFGQRKTYVSRLDGRDTVLRNPNPNRQIGSAYAQLDALQKLTWQPNERWRWQLNIQYSTSSDIPRYDRLTERRAGQLRFAEWYYGPQQRLLLAVQTHWTSRQAWADQVRFVLSQQRLAEDRYERRLYNDWRERSHVAVVANNFTVDAQKELLLGSFHYGLDARAEAVASRADRLNISNGAVRQDINSRYPSRGSTLTGLGAYAQWRYESSDSLWQVEVGGRWSTQQIHARFGENDPIEWPTSYVRGLHQNNSATSGALGWRRHLGVWQLSSHFATGFRAPNVDDFVKFREKNGFLQIPNPDLRPERTRTLDVRLVYTPTANFRAEFSIFHTWLLDAMTRQDGRLPNGQRTLWNGFDSLAVQTIVNSDRAQIWGAQLSMNWKISRHWTLDGQWTSTQGERQLALPNSAAIAVPMDHIPPFFGQSTLSYRRQRWEVALRADFQAAKRVEDYAVSAVQSNETGYVLDRLGTSDNLEQTPFELATGQHAGSYAWWTLNGRVALRVRNNWRIRLAVNNVLDVHYRTFSSGISAPGRDVILGVYAWF